jgi:ADP-ribosyl-[dinitrogen reductase] hydrolase
MYKMDSMIGALVGDAAGATLEFYHGEITEEKALAAMKMPGGGAHRVGPGQITDDGELALSLWRGLTDANGEDIEGIQIAIAKEYVNWYASCPFDIGQTCSFAFQTLYDHFRPRRHSSPLHKTFKECLESIEKINYRSEANGAMMRASAIATWAAAHPAISAEVAGKVAKADARLSHPSTVCQEANAVYVFTIVLLLRGVPPESIITEIDEYVAEHVTSPIVRKWWHEESIALPTSVIDCAGHVRWGFVLAMYFLRHPEIDYEEAIKITLMLGGDTDTNAAIVGGLVGTYKPIPDYMVRPVMTFDCVAEAPGHQIRLLEFSVARVIRHLL